MVSDGSGTVEPIGLFEGKPELHIKNYIFVIKSNIAAKTIFLLQTHQMGSPGDKFLEIQKF